MLSINDILNLSVPNRHSFFQLNFFVLGKEPTHQAKLKRCVEELRSRKVSSEAMVLEIEDLEDRNHLLKWEMDNAKYVDETERDIKFRMLNRKIIANNKAIIDLKDRMKNVGEEMGFFVEAFNRLNQIEPMKQWDEAEVQSQYWNAKITEEVNHRILMQLPIDAEIIKTALSLPNSSSVKKQVIALLKKQTLALEKGIKDAETCRQDQHT